jgi:UrcA family protein
MTTSRLFASFIGAGILAGALLAPQLTYADSPDHAPTAAVRLADLNLDTRSGVATLFSRIELAAHVVCSPYDAYDSALPSAAHQQCLRTAVAEAVRNVGSPLLTAYYSERDSRHTLATASR